MCLILEHARAKQQIIELTAKIAELEKQELFIPVIDLTMITHEAYLSEFAKAGIKPIDSASPFDSMLSITTKAELDRMAPFLVYPADFYIAEIWDCEDYGIQAQADAAHKFHVSGVRLGLGNMPQGYHGFVLTMDKNLNIWVLEPNAGFSYAGEWFEVGDNLYFPNKVLA